MERRLHIGGQERKEGWEIFNILPGDIVDHVGHACDLACFDDNTFTEIYASHILEHLDYKKEIYTALKEWYRVLKTGGRLYVSTPDMDVLAKLFLMKDKLTVEQQFGVMRVLFGGHGDQHDYHKVGLTFLFLGHYLVSAGFKNVERVETFGMFNDASKKRLGGLLISVNVIAEK